MSSKEASANFVLTRRQFYTDETSILHLRDVIFILMRPWNNIIAPPQEVDTGLNWMDRTIYRSQQKKNKKKT